MFWEHSFTYHTSKMQQALSQELNRVVENSVCCFKGLTVPWRKQAFDHWLQQRVTDTASGYSRGMGRLSGDAGGQEMCDEVLEEWRRNFPCLGLRAGPWLCFVHSNPTSWAWRLPQLPSRASKLDSHYVPTRSMSTKLKPLLFFSPNRSHLGIKRETV